MQKIILLLFVIVAQLFCFLPGYARTNGNLLLTVPPILAATKHHEVFLYSGNWTGTFSGTDSGTWAVSIDTKGLIHGTGYSNDLRASFTLTGNVSGNIFSAEAFATGGATTGSVFSGVINDPGVVTGTWVNHQYANESGDFTGSLEGITTGDTDTGGSSQTVVEGGREWQRLDPGTKYTWEQANNYCQQLILEGSSDWRLPNEDELKSLVICTVTVPTVGQEQSYCRGDHPLNYYQSPTIDLSKFSCSEEGCHYFWTSVRDESNVNPVYLEINFETGALWYRYNADAPIRSYVRCIRN